MLTRLRLFTPRMQGALRMVVLDLLHSTGVHVQKDMHLPTITHIIAKQVDDNSQKLVQARRCGLGLQSCYRGSEIVKP